jgi:hypothetical protein
MSALPPDGALRQFRRNRRGHPSSIEAVEPMYLNNLMFNNDISIIARPDSRAPIRGGGRKVTEMLWDYG